MPNAADVTGDWIHNQNNELESYDGLSFTYDANGSTTGKLATGQPVNSYAYNVENRLARVEDGGSSAIAEYYYDPFGRRLWKDVAGTKTYFFYADEGLVGEYDTTGTGIKTYGYRPNSTWTTDPLFMKQGTEYYFYQNDHLGTPQTITDINGNVVWSAKYGSFGGATVEIEAIVNNLRFPGQCWDEETGLHYNWHRDYHPGIGRYIEVDPAEFDGRLGFYCYSNENPISRIDPRGLEDYFDCVLRKEKCYLDADAKYRNCLAKLGPWLYIPLTEAISAAQFAKCNDEYLKDTKICDAIVCCPTYY